MQLLILFKLAEKVCSCGHFVPATCCRNSNQNNIFGKNGGCCIKNISPSVYWPLTCVLQIIVRKKEMSISTGAGGDYFSFHNSIFPFMLFSLFASLIISDMHQIRNYIILFWAFHSYKRPFFIRK